MNAADRRRGRGLLLPSLVTLLAFTVLVSLGVWQLERKQWKENLIERLTARVAAAPTALPSAAEWPKLDPDTSEFRRVRLSADILPGQEALVFSSGTNLRPDASGPGYWVFAPARLADGSIVVVNRGFVPEAKRAVRAEWQASGPREIVGAMRWPEAPNLFTPDGDPAKNLWFVRDQQRMASAKGWGSVAPFFIEQEAPPAPGGLPQVGNLVPNLPNNHLGYAITWFGLALVLVGVFVAFIRARLSRGTHPAQVADRG